MKTILTDILFAMLPFATSMPGQNRLVMHQSHDATVKIVSLQGSSSGTGFFVGRNLIVTCFHVVFSGQRNPGTGLINGTIFQDLMVTLPSGEIIPAKVVSIPTEQDTTPLQYDFAFLKLVRAPAKQATFLQFATNKELTEVDLGDNLIFSGYPLATPGMVTHQGSMSGASDDKELFFVQASINKGNSGGALLNNNGNVIGIVSLREGRVSSASLSLKQQNEQTAQRGSVTIMGMDPLASTNALIDTIDQYISVGIGYARSSIFAKNYLDLHPALSK